MSSCDLKEFTCGTGLTGGSIPKPGDPDNFGNISASGLVGGIRVRWTFPLMNAHAVAHIKVMRSGTPFKEDAYEIARVNSSYFEDWFEGSPMTYYYWIQFVSIQGTEHEWIGPAGATSFNEALRYLEALHGKINNSLLSQELRKEIELIQLNKLGITQEMIERAKSDDALGVAFNEIKAFTETTRALVQEETLARASADEAFVSTVNTLYADLEGNIAAVQNERLARVTANEALAQNIETTQTVLGNNIASVQTNMESKINIVDGKVQQIGALYTARLSVNGLIGGFGIYNDGRKIDAGFDVDRFWIGSSSRKYKPFIIDGNEIYLNGKVTFSNLQGAGTLAGKNSLSYSEVTGSKPPTNADNTGSNTARDTQRVGGTWASTVRDNAAAGASGAARVSSWTRPGTTSINGNQIHTGDAYVDTLEIKGEAVTIPRSASGGYSASVTFYAPVGMNVVVIGVFTQGAGREGVGVYITHNGGWLQVERPRAGTTGALARTVYVGRGTHTFGIATEENTGNMNCSIVVLGTKR